MSLSEKLKAIRSVVDTNEEKQQQKIIKKREQIVTNLFNRLAQGEDSSAARSLIADGSAVVTIASCDLTGGFNLFARMLGNKLSDKAVCIGIDMEMISANEAYHHFKEELAEAGYNIVGEAVQQEQDAPNILRMQYVVCVAAANAPN